MSNTEEVTAVQPVFTEQAITEESTFYHRNLANLGEFVEIFGVDSRTVDSLDGLVEATQPWVTGDHTRPENHTSVTEAQSERLSDLYRTFGIKQERLLLPGHYDQVIVLGAMHRGNHRRLEYLNNMLADSDISTDMMVLLGGERTIYPEAENTLIAEDIDILSQREHTDPYIQKVASGEAYPVRETDLFRMAAAVELGNMVVKGETEERIEFEYNGMPVHLIHTKAVHRPNGAPRHTTEACMSDFIKIVNPRRAARVGFIATNPHIERTARSARRIIMSQGRADIQLVPAGPSALDGYSHELFRGEVARLLYEDKIQLDSLSYEN